MLLLIISFIAGGLTVFAPCVLPLLPVILGSSIASNAKDKVRPYVIAASLALSIIGFTLLLKFSTILINLSSNDLDYFSGVLLVILGFFTAVPEIWERLVVQVNFQAVSQRLLSKSEHQSGRYLGPIVIGLALGPVFSSCSPTYAFILASILPHSFGSGLIYLCVYSLGVVLTLLVVSLIGRKVIDRYSWAIDTHGKFRRSIGLLFVVIGVVIFIGKMNNVEVWVADHTPFDETKIERLLLSKQHKDNLIHNISADIKRNSVLNVQSVPAPQFVGLTNWINSSPLTLKQLKGKVVLVDFWTYSCINCIRSIPYVEKWYQAYKNDGLVVVGVSTPEFAFEHDPDNVQAAVKRDGITYPVALDNNEDTWNAFDNDSWPADYLIDRSGNIRYDSEGEGNYTQTNEAIEDLLGINKPLVTPTFNVPVSSDQTNETYFGTYREYGYVGSQSYETGTYGFTPAKHLTSGAYTLGGQWLIGSHSITSESSSSTLTFDLTAKNVYLVAGSSEANNVTVSLPTDHAGQYGSDDPNGTATISGSRLYNIASFNKLSTATITLTVPQGVTLYTFTFGS
jgi:cytochrome c biogenesis protein CcdA/thiol-disulfide isomerase/thioredoxin